MVLSYSPMTASLLYANQYAKSLLSPEGLVGQTFSTFVLSDDRVYFQSMLSAADGGKYGELMLHSPQGGFIPALISLKQMPPEETIPGICLTITNLSEQHQAKAALQEAKDTLENRVDDRTVQLRESFERFRFLAESMPQKIFTALPDGSIDYFNQQWMEFTGLASDQIKNIGWSEFIHADDLPDNIRRWRESVTLGTPFQLEHRFRRSDGGYRWHLSRALPMFDSNHKIVMWTGSSTDIHDYKQLEEKLVAADRRKDEFLAIVSHELRTPLTAMLGWVRLLRTGKLDAKRAASALEVIDRNVTTQATLIEDLLDVSRIITGKMTLDAQPVDMIAVINAAIESVHIAAQTKGIKIRTRLTPIRLVGDPHRLQQVVWNLLSNAVKFTPTGGDVTITLDTTASQAQIQVQDSGIGIEAEFLPYVFERFSQADSSKSRSYGGLGIGLAIVRHLVELHGGRVSVTSAGEGMGAVFTVTIPIKAVVRSELTDSKIMQRRPSLTNLRVLLVDDDPDARDLLKTILVLTGANVEEAGSAKDALIIIRQFKPDILISDIGMPGETGYDLIRNIRAIPEEYFQELPAIALTAYARNEDRIKALQAGFQTHLQKPIDPDVFVATIKSLLNK